MWIESIIRRPAGTTVKLGDTTYRFVPYSSTDKRHLCDVENTDDAQTFLAIKEGYRIAKPAPATKTVKPVGPDNPQPPTLSAEEQAALDEAEKEIADAEAKIAAVKAAKQAAPKATVTPLRPKTK